jgi:DNA-binding NtrC family response regulator
MVKESSEVRRILVVEDEDVVRSFVISLLELHGYEVVAVDSAERAITAFLLQKDDIHLVFADINLPGRSGIQLMEEIRAFEPQVSFVMGSGDPYCLESTRLYECAFIPKPYNPDRLIGVIQEQMRRTNL